MAGPRLPHLLALAALFTVPLGAQRVLLVSFDGLGHQILTADPAAEELRTFHRLMRQGATFDGIQPHFPSTTANSHAAIWTGAYGDVSGISFNHNVPVRERRGRFATGKTDFDRFN